MIYLLLPVGAFLLIMIVPSVEHGYWPLLAFSVGWLVMLLIYIYESNQIPEPREWHSEKSREYNRLQSKLVNKTLLDCLYTFVLPNVLFFAGRTLAEQGQSLWPHHSAYALVAVMLIAFATMTLKPMWKYMLWALPFAPYSYYYFY